MIQGCLHDTAKVTGLRLPASPDEAPRVVGQPRFSNMYSKNVPGGFHPFHLIDLLLESSDQPITCYLLPVPDFPAGLVFALPVFRLDVILALAGFVVYFKNAAFELGDVSVMA